jgi:hypothetical protein
MAEGSSTVPLPSAGFEPVPINEMTLKQACEALGVLALQIEATTLRFERLSFQPEVQRGKV